MKNIWFLLCLVLSMPAILLAQEPEHLGVAQDSTQVTNNIYGYHVVARSYGDSVVLRWAPSNAGVWMMGNQYGWKIARSSDNPNDTIYEYFLTPEPLVPLTLDQMMQRFDSTNFMAGVAAQALYGEGVFNPTSSNSTFTNYVFRRDQEQRQRQLLAYLAAEADPQVASALALRFVDKTVRPGSVYQYTIYPQIPAKYADMEIISKIIYTQPFVRSSDELIPSVNIRQIDPYRAVVMCPANKLTGYYFERSIDGKHWEKLNEAPVYVMDPEPGTAKVYGDSVAEWMKYNAVLVDSLEVRKTYTYRVRAYDAFGDFAPMVTSNKFEMEDLIPPFPPVLHAIPVEDNMICKLYWEKEIIEDDFDGYFVIFAPDVDGPWEEVTDMLPAKTTEYIDKEGGKRGRGYYRIIAVDKYGNFSYSTPQINNVEDIYPPQAPIGLRGLIDEKGFLYLDWVPNKENDLLGYRVYYANQADHVFTECSSGYLSNPVFQNVVDIKTITQHIYFYVIAVDKSFNYSKPSDTLQLRLPDSIPPGIVLLEKMYQDNGAVYIDWRKSVSADVVAYYIYRKPTPHKRWECIYIATPADVSEDGLLHFVDYPTASDVPYSYCIEAMDDWQQTSGKNAEFSILVKPPLEIDVKMKLQGSVNKEKKGVGLKWDYTYDGDDDHYGVVYRSTIDGEWEDIYAFKRGETSFVDQNVKAGNKYSYYIQLVFSKGRRSKPSKVVLVKF